MLIERPVLKLENKPNDELALPLKAAGVEVHLIGDCRAARNILAATAEGDAIGRAL